MTMVALTAACAMLIVAVLRFIVRPLQVSGRGRATAQPPDANVAVYRRQLDELESDRRQGLFSEDEFLVERDDLERRVIADLPERSRPDDRVWPSADAARLRYILAIGMALAAALLYLALGAPHVINQSP
jgi:cytochrome c-type biogenesis protein CcmH